MIRIDAAWLATTPLDMRAGTDTALARVVAVFGAAHQGGVCRVLTNESHVGALHGFADRLCIVPIVLAALDKRTHKLGADKPNVVPKAVTGALANRLYGFCVTTVVEGLAEFDRWPTLRLLCDF